MVVCLAHLSGTAINAQRIFYDTGLSGTIREVDGGGNTLIYSAPQDWQIRPIDTTLDFGGRIYWIERISGAPNTVLSCRLDGTDVRTELTGLTNAWNIQIDGQNRFAYWMDISQQRIFRARLESNGSFEPNSTVALIEIGGNFGGGLRLDLDNQKIYWSDFSGIKVADLDGSNVSTFYNTIPGDAVAVGEIALDANGNVYWINAGLNGGMDAILRADPDGSNVQTLFSNFFVGFNNLEIDKQGGHLFFASSGIFRSELNGANAQQFSTVFGVSSIDIPELPNCLLGDVSRNGAVDLLDVAPFVDQIISGEYSCEADVSRDGVVDLLDVQPFVNLL